MGDFVKVGRLEDFREGRGRPVKLDGVRVAVFNHGGTFHALQDKCPHMGAWLSEGRIQGGNAVCHMHGWKFDLRTGQADQRSWACAKIYEVKIEGEEVFLRRPDPEPPKKNDADDEWPLWDDRFLKSGGGD